MKYPIAIEPGDKSHAYGVVVPDLPGCFSAGDTIELAYENAKEAIAGWIEMELDEGHPIPLPSKIWQDKKNLKVGFLVSWMCQKSSYLIRLCGSILLYLLGY